MAQLSPSQRAWRRRIEGLLHVAAPALDLMLAAGDRLSRVVESDDLDWVPPRKAIGVVPPHPDAIEPAPRT